MQALTAERSEVRASRGRGRVGVFLAMAVAVMLTAMAVPAQAAEAPSARHTSAQVKQVHVKSVAPVGARAAGGGQDIGIGGCGFLQNCVYLNQQDQRALIAGGAAAIVLAICAAGPPACAVATVIGAVAFVYVGDHGICSGGRLLQIQWFPRVRPEGCK